MELKLFSGYLIELWFCCLHWYVNVYDRCTVSGGLVGECFNICMKTCFKCKLSAAVFFHFLAIWGSGLGFNTAHFFLSVIP